MDLISSTDRGIFEEFDARVEGNVRAQQKLSVAQRIARMTVKEVDDASILQIFDLSPRELSEVRKLPEYQTEYQNASSEMIEQPLEIDSDWDAVERKALRAAVESLDFTDGETALRMASMANRATRRTRENVINDDSRGVKINTVNIAVPRQLMETLQKINLPLEMQRLFKANEQNKIVDLARPKRIEELMREKGREAQLDADINDVFENS